MKNIYPVRCPHCRLKSLFTHKDMVTKIDYYNIFENWVEWSTVVYCPFCETPITLGGGGNNFWSLFTLRYFFQKLLNKIIK
jgi:hypothetical protein